ncbi:hypothetical protein V1524DRAFT_63462 [Lipomyces starkeyi]
MDEKEVVLVTQGFRVMMKPTLIAMTTKLEHTLKPWIEKNEYSIKKKGQGVGMMVSDFYCACHGLNANGESVRVILEPGKNRQGYWRSPQMCEQRTRHSGI